MEIGKELRKFNVQIAVLVLSLAVYLLTQSPLVALLIAVEIFGFVALEIKDGVKHHGIKHEVIDTLVALAVALAIWYGSAFLLNTSSPLSAVVSCSMLPNLQRGDFVIVQGVRPVAYELAFTEKQMNDFLNPEVLISASDGSTKKVSGSMYSYCTFNAADPLCQQFVSNPTAFKESRGSLDFYYTACPLQTKDGLRYQPCIEKVVFDGKVYLTNYSHDTIVYQPEKTDLFALSGDIVHRAFFVINSPKGNYYLQRGDNNPVLDVQVFDYQRQLGNSPVSAGNIKGKVLGRIPLLGYFKLFISGFFSEPAQCKTQLSYEHV